MTNLEYARRTRGWSLKQLGHLRTVRMGPSYIGLMEKKRFSPDDDQRNRLARALDLPPELLLEDIAVVTPLPPVVEEPLDEPENIHVPATA